MNKVGCSGGWNSGHWGRGRKDGGLLSSFLMSTIEGNDKLQSSGGDRGGGYLGPPLKLWSLHCIQGWVKLELRLGDPLVCLWLFCYVLHVIAFPKENFLYCILIHLEKNLSEILQSNKFFLIGF